jgi:catechol 2,3-dioxygenase-like lactoylglutathione lyase family enzyme
MPSTILAARLRRIPVVATGAFFALSVPDFDASAEWYSEKLGLKITMREPKTIGAAVTVCLDCFRAISRSPQPASERYRKRRYRQPDSVPRAAQLG